LPLAATLSTDRIYEQFLAPKEEGKTFFHGHTYTGNALACSAALANLQTFDDENTIENLQPKIRILHTLLAAIQSHPNVGEVRQRGMMVGIELVADRENYTAFPSEKLVGHRICMEARRHGVIIRNLGDVLVLMPPLSITEDELTTLVRATEAALVAVTS
ncbi:MAG: aminotransferase class III-fold pyridoxal phosphate-dependent enzyme, partial [Kofleriaceae bacterium]|nr:aminotransferase class III-fold pyridoxal phosphate-dependent enzyme [Kofleriaceae bacterium]